ncbi:MAG: helix-turn-helix transcriptional regulator [Proteobacteria bacterium]|nr:helix-turn-helix transcriptional regulator [Pseudomonadota bacterium]
MSIQIDAFSQLPGLQIIKNHDGNYSHITDYFAQYIGYKSSNQFLEHERSDFDIRTKAVELALSYREEDHQVRTTLQPLKQIGIWVFKDGLRFLLGGKSPIYDSHEKKCSVALNYIDITDSQLKHFLFDYANKTKYSYFKNKDQFTCYLKSSFDNNLFSKRESECVYYMIRGKSAALIAEILGIDKRTVETYFENIKNKFGCDNKGQVIEKALALGYYYIIPESILNNKNIFE